MFNFLYEMLAGQNSDPTYTAVVFPFVGLFTLLLAIATVLIFYLALGRYRPVWDKPVHWFITLTALLGIAFWFALCNAQAETGETANYYIYRFALINVLYAFLYYAIFSLIIKKFSIYAKRTPF